MDMPPSRSSDSSNIVFFTYKRRKVAAARPGTYEDALKFAKRTFIALQAILPEEICISACLPEHEEEGVVEIAPDAWNLAANGVKHFTVGIVDDETKGEALESVKKEIKEEAGVPMPLQPMRPVPFSAQPSTAGPSRVPHLPRPGGQEIWITARQLTGQDDYIGDLYPSDDIYRLKMKVQEVSGLPIDDQRLIFAGLQLEEGRTLADYYITSGAIVHVVLRLRGAKPVIYLFPPITTNVKVRLSLVPRWRFSAVYPQPLGGSFKEGASSQTAEWDVVAHPNGMMAVGGDSTEVAYIFWEAETESQHNLPDSPPTSRPPSPRPEARLGMLRPREGFVPGTTRCGPHDSVVLSVQDVPPYLEKALFALGFHTEARTSFITYWLPSFLKHEYLALRFVAQADFEASAPLYIEPNPDVVTRVFMLFEGIPTERLPDWKEARERSSADVSMWKGIVGVEEGRQSDEDLFRVLEWGGMEAQLDMPPSRSSESSNVVFVTYKRRKVAFARPATYEDALNLAKKTFTPLKAMPPERIYISACLPDHEEEGVVEITPEAWQLATKGVKQFTIGILDEDVKVGGLEGVKKEKEEEVAAPVPLQQLRPLRICTPPPRASGSTAPRIYEPRNLGFWVAVVGHTGKVDYITDLDPSDNISNIKLKYQDVSGIPPDQQRMIFGGKQLADDWTLADCSIVSGAVLHMVIRLRGGKPVIYLYPPTSINAKVSLSLVPQWSFSAVYPHPVKGSFKEGKSSQTAQWDVIAQPNGMMTLQESSAEVAYIFWEAETECHDDLPESPPLSRSSSPLLGAELDMPPSRTAESSNVVFFTYKRRKVAFARPETYEVKADALNLAKKTFTALKALPPERICISACLPEHEQEGVVEIAPEAWQIATKGVKQFSVGIVEEEEIGEELEAVKKEKEEEGGMAVPMPVQPMLPLPFAPPPNTMHHFGAPRIPVLGGQAFWVLAKSLTGRNDYITDIRASDRIDTLKMKIEQVSGVIVDDQRLIFAGIELQDRQTLADYRIPSGATITVVYRLRGAKPVIYLFPPTSISVKVQLSLVPHWRLSAVYPQPIKGSFKEGRSSQNAEWHVVAQPSGMMTVEGTSAEITYIFWEAETGSPNVLPDSPPTSRSPSPSSSPRLGARLETLRPRGAFVPGTTRCSPHDSVVLSVQDVPPYLEKALLALGFHTEARTSFITYWLPSFLKHEHLALRFIPQIDFEASAPLNIDPKPDVVTRVFMLFEGIQKDRLAEWEEARERSSADVNMWKGIVGVEDTRKRDQNLFRVLEWG
ncbi:hypothetical protein FRC01_002996, partial [Tulasnella sp. 417]